jgi:hypothetical protein
MVRKAAGFLSSLILVLLVLGGSGCAASAKIAAADVPRMQVDELNARLGDPSLAIIDVRQTGDWEASSVKIKGAIREEYKGVSDWASNYSKDKTIVLYCT